MINPKWFTRKKNTIIGISQSGLLKMPEAGLTEIRLPCEIGGYEIKSINRGTVIELCTRVPSIETVIIPAGMNIVLDSPEGLSKAGNLKKIVFQKGADFKFSFIGQGIERVDILEEDKYKSIDGIVYSEDGRELVYYPRGKRDEKYEIPDSVQMVGDCALNGCLIDELIIPETVKTLGKDCVADSTINKLSIPGSIKEIPWGAFENCKILQELIFHEGLKFIGPKNFFGCEAKEILFPESLLFIRQESFKECTSKFVFLSDDTLVDYSTFAGYKGEDKQFLESLESRRQSFSDSKYNSIAYRRAEDIEKVQELAHKKVDIPDSMSMLDINELINVYTIIDSSTNCIDGKYVLKEKFISPKIDIAAFKINDLELFKAVQERHIHRYCEVHDEFFISFYNRGVEWADAVLNSGNYCQEMLDRALWEAAQSTDIPLVKYLLEHGANPEYPYRFSVSAIKLTIRDYKHRPEKYLEVLKLLLEAVGNPDTSPLLPWALRFNDEDSEIVKFIKEKATD